MVRFRLWRNLSDESGLTLIELLGVALIMLLLALLAIPVYAGVTDQVRFTQSMSNLRTIEQALERHKAEFGYYPGRLKTLVDKGYLKSAVTFESAWSESSDHVYLFYAIDRTEKPQGFILADPGPDATQGDCKSSATTAALLRNVTDPFPCGATPTRAAWHWTGASPTLRLPDDTGAPPASLRDYRRFCDPLAPTKKRIIDKVQCVYKAEQ